MTHQYMVELRIRKRRMRILKAKSKDWVKLAMFTVWLSCVVALVLRFTQ